MYKNVARLIYLQTFNGKFIAPFFHFIKTLTISSIFHGRNSSDGNMVFIQCSSFIFKSGISAPKRILDTYICIKYGMVLF